jgi:polyferredoxin
MSAAAAALRRVKVAHTIAWAFFAGCIVAVPVAAWRGDFRAAFVLIAIVFVEVFVLVANGWRCPLTDVAARYTDDRRDNFDIYLPLWLARHNKLLFGALFAAGLVFTLARWIESAG